jgi:hypothetical protein
VNSRQGDLANTSWLRLSRSDSFNALSGDGGLQDGRQTATNHTVVNGYPKEPLFCVGPAFRAKFSERRRRAAGANSSSMLFCRLSE